MSTKEHKKNPRELLMEIDKATFEGRAENLSLMMLFVELDKKFSVYPLSKNIQGFRKEALTDFINGCFRSCIFSCASAVEQAFKENLIVDSSDPEETMWEFQIKRTSFKNIIRKARQNNNLEKVADVADNLRKLRNEIAVHPMQIPLFPEPRSKDRIILTNRTMIRSTRKTLAFLDSKLREDIMDIDLVKKGHENRTLREILQDPTVPHIRIVWEEIQRLTLRALAFLALEMMWQVMIELYGKEED